MSRNMANRCIVSCLALPLLAAVGLAQGGEGSHWNTIPLPAGTQALRAMGTTVTVKTPTRIQIYSAILRRWTVLPVSATAVLATHNAYATVEDGTQVHGWASRIGKVSSITVGATRKVIPGPASANWVTVVHDGTKVWAFSAFHGKWAALTVKKSAPTIAVGQMCAVVQDGFQAYGFSVYHGTWVPTLAPGATVAVTAIGTVGMANSPTVIRGFAAGTNTWASHTVASTTNVTMGRGYALITNGNKVTAFSGFRANFSTYTAPASGFGLIARRNTAAIAHGNTVACYAATQGSFQTTSMTTPVVDANSELLVISSTSDKRVVGFSGVTGRFSAPLSGTYTISTDESAAFAKSATSSWAYSPILDRWIKNTQGVFTAVTLMRNSVVLSHPWGFSGLSTRTGRWVRLVASKSATLQGPRRGRGALLAVVDGAKVHAWDSRLSRWATVTATTTPKTNLAIFRVVAIGENGSTGYGFGLFENVWDTVQIQGTVKSFKASSACGYIETNTHLHIFTSHGSLSTLSRFPEFSRFLLRGSNLRMIQVAPARSLAVSLLGFGPGFTQTTLGTLFLDPTLPLLPLGGAVVPADGRLDTLLPIRNDPSLRGKILNIQDFILPPNRIPYLTNSIAPVIV
jgi:hypothetical protein